MCMHVAMYVRDKNVSMHVQRTGVELNSSVDVILCSAAVLTCLVFDWSDYLVRGVG